jgi:hypothetical protein
MSAVRMDVCAFAGVAPRGPAFEAADPHDWPWSDGLVRTRSVPVAVESWDDYAELFGSFEGPGLLPYAVAAFFQQGGQRAQVIRIVHDPGDVSDGAAPPPGRARHDFGAAVTALGGGTVSLVARNEGSWGDRLGCTLSFATAGLNCLGAEPGALVFDRQALLSTGCWLRLVLADGSRALRAVTSVSVHGLANGTGSVQVATLDSPVTAPVLVERVDAALQVVDRDPLRARREQYGGLGLLPSHPNWIGRALQQSSALVELVGAEQGIALGDVTLEPQHSTLALAGADRYAAVVPGDVFGSRLVGGDDAADGLDALARVPEVASIVVADLYSPAAVPESSVVADPPTLAGPDFAPCVELPGSAALTAQPAGLDGLRLDPLDSADLATIVQLQQGVVAYAEALDAVALLDVPPGLNQRAVLAWRASFDSSHAAGYHPWIVAPLAAQPATGALAGGATSAASPALVTANPSAFAAGVIARTEAAFGVPHGPGNALLSGAVELTDVLSPARLAALHQDGVDVSVKRSGGIWLVGARTLSRDPTWRQLSVRRVVSLVERSIRAELAWTVFEPNDRRLRSGLELLLGGLLRQLFVQGAFAGATPAESYFVRTASDAELAAESDAGELVCQVGLAVAEPLEFVLVTISRDANGALTTETFGG